MKITSILINFYDNDFIRTYKPLIESIMIAIKQRDIEINIEIIKQMIYFGTPYFYFSFQHRLEDKDYLETTLAYLRNPCDIIINTAADEFILDEQNKNNFNGNIAYINIYMENAEVY